MQKFTGEITHILPILEKDEWASIEFRVLDNTGQHPQSAIFRKFGKGEYKKYVLEFENYNKVGDYVEVEYSHRTKEYNNKWYNELSCFKTTVLKKSVHNENTNNSKNNMDDDLPF